MLGPREAPTLRHRAPCPRVRRACTAQPRAGSVTAPPHTRPCGGSRRPCPHLSDVTVTVVSAGRTQTRLRHRPSSMFVGRARAHHQASPLIPPRPTPPNGRIHLLSVSIYPAHPPQALPRAGDHAGSRSRRVDRGRHHAHSRAAGGRIPSRIPRRILWRTPSHAFHAVPARLLSEAFQLPEFVGRASMAAAVHQRTLWRKALRPGHAAGPPGRRPLSPVVGGMYSGSRLA